MFEESAEKDLIYEQLGSDAWRLINKIFSSPQKQKIPNRRSKWTV